METPNEKNWHVDTGGSVLETDAETLKQWIWEGTVLPHHRVSRGGLRWLEAIKVPQFAEHFATAKEMNDLLGNTVAPPPQAASTPVFTPPPRRPVSEFDDRYALPSEKIKMAETPFHIKLMASSAIVLVLAIVGGYLYAYHISSPREVAAMKDDPKLVEIQTKFDKDKAAIEEFRNAKPAFTPAAPRASGPRLGPAKTGDIARGPLAYFDASQLPNFDNTPPQPDLSALMPHHDYDGELKNLNAKFETDKNKVITDIRAADSKKRFPAAAFLLFIGLGGVNLVRLRVSSKKS